MLVIFIIEFLLLQNPTVFSLKNLKKLLVSGINGGETIRGNTVSVLGQTAKHLNYTI